MVSPGASTKRRARMPTADGARLALLANWRRAKQAARDGRRMPSFNRRASRRSYRPNEQRRNGRLPNSLNGMTRVTADLAAIRMLQPDITAILFSGLGAREARF